MPAKRVGTSLGLGNERQWRPLNLKVLGELRPYGRVLRDERKRRKVPSKLLGQKARDYGVPMMAGCPTRSWTVEADSYGDLVTSVCIFPVPEGVINVLTHRASDDNDPSLDLECRLGSGPQEPTNVPSSMSHAGGLA